MKKGARRQGVDVSEHGHLANPYHIASVKIVAFDRIHRLFIYYCSFNTKRYKQIRKNGKPLFWFVLEILGLFQGANWTVSPTGTFYIS